MIWQCPIDAAAACVLAHGAGAGMQHRNMQAIADAFEREGIGTLRFDFPFIEAGRSRVDAKDVSTASIAAAYRALQQRCDLPLWLAGHSFGGRMASHAVLDEALGPRRPRGLILCAFPLHTAGKPSIQRAAHLGQIELPMLFLSGTRDKLAEAALLEETVRGLDHSRLHWLDTADHGYKILKRSRRSAEDIFAEMARVARRFIDEQA
jgi:predicted alpha/beta-hydrolase family hydrolase